MTPITFDVILPTLGRASVFDAIRSVNAQDYREFYLWVICDGLKQLIGPNNANVASTPSPGEIVGSPFMNHGDSGAWARNEGIRLGDNNWIAYIDDDDVWYPNHLTTIVEYITLDPSVNMVRTAGQSFALKHKSPRSKQLVKKMGQVNDTDILTVGMAHTRSLFEQTHGWGLGESHDRDLWNNMLRIGGKALTTNHVTFEFAR